RLYSEGVALRELQYPEPAGRSIAWDSWQKEVEKYAERAEEPPDDFGDLPQHSLVTPHAILQLDRVRQARESIVGAEDDPEQGGLLRELEDLRDIAAALGLLPRTPERPALLEVPRKADGETPNLLP